MRDLWTLFRSTVLKCLCMLSAVERVRQTQHLDETAHLRAPTLRLAAFSKEKGPIAVGQHTQDVQQDLDRKVLSSPRRMLHSESRGWLGIGQEFSLNPLSHTGATFFACRWLTCRPCSTDRLVHQFGLLHWNSHVQTCIASDVST